MNNVAGMVGLAVAVVAAIGFAVAYARANLAKNTIDIYKADNDALRGRVETLEDEKRALTDDVGRLKVRLAAQETQIKTLADVVTGTSAVQRLADQVAANHAEVLRSLKDIAVLAGNHRE